MSLRQSLSQIVQSRFLPEDLASSQAGQAPPGTPGSRGGGDARSAGAAAGTSAARVYLMQAAGELATFFGTEMAMTALVPAFMYLPNETNWRVRAAFYHHLPEVATTVVRACHFVHASCTQHACTSSTPAPHAAAPAWGAPAISVPSRV